MNAPAGFTQIHDLPFSIGSKRPVLSAARADMTLYGSSAERKLWGTVRFGEEFHGPPGHAHGGAQAFILDEAMGVVCWHCDIPVVAQSIEIQFMQLVPLHVDLIVTASVVGRGARNIDVTSRLSTADGVPLAAGSGQFHVITYAQFSKFIGPMTPELKRWFPGE